MVDGQQRLTTLSLLYCSIYRLLKQKTADSPEFTITLEMLKWKLVQRSRHQDLKLEPSTQNSNLADYKSVLSDIGLATEATRPSYRNRRRIYGAFEYFCDRLEDRSAEQLEQLIKKTNDTLLQKKAKSIPIRTRSCFLKA